MSVLKRTLEIVAGDSKTYSLAFTDNGVAIDINGWTVYMTIYNDDTKVAVLSKVVTSHTTPGSGLTQINLTAAETALLSIDTYIYDIRVKTDTTTVFTVIKGSFQVQQNITVVL